MKSRLSAKEIDKLEAEAIVLPFFSDERPLRGANGLIDWRMNGSISRLLLSGKVTGERGESTLILPKKRIKGEKILMVGLGDSRQFSVPYFEEVAADILKQVVKIKVKNFTLAIPSKKYTAADTAVASTTVIQGMQKAVKEEKIRDDDIFVTIAVEKGEMEEAKAATEKLSKTPKEKG